MTPVAARDAGRLAFIDNIRTCLTVLVVGHHLMVIYAGGGSWIWLEGRQDEITSALGGWFCAVNQSYFMGLFLFISAFFIPGSYDRKGAWPFLKDRLIRLGIPLAVYGWILRPALIYLLRTGAGDVSAPPWEWYARTYFAQFGIIGGGPLWFIEALLIFSVLYVLWRLLTRSQPVPPSRDAVFPGIPAVALCALLLGAATFLVRLLFPVGSSFNPLNLQLSHFAGYILLFVLGMVAYRRNWLGALPQVAGRFWLWTSFGLILLYPVLAVLGGATEDPEPFMGGWHWQSLLYATWEAFMSVGMCIGLIHLFRSRWNRQGAPARLLSRHAYTAYLIHEPVITLLAVAAAGITLYPLLKFGLAAVLFTPVCFALSVAVRRIPGVDRVL